MNWKLIPLTSCALALGAQAAPVAPADPSVPHPAPAVLLDDVEDALEEIIDEYMEAVQAFRKVYSAAQTDEERRALIAERAPDAGPFAARALALAKQHPGTDGAWEALAWVVGRARGTEAAAEAFQVLTSEYLEDERLSDICLGAGRSPHSTAVVESLARVIEKSPHREVRGRAAFALGMQYKKLVQAEPELGTTGLKRVTKDGGPLELFKRQMQLVIEEYADVPYYRGDLGAKAASEVFELERLQIGMIAPDIEGEDLDGVAFKLSDYHGKVVVLDFWGNW